MKLSDYVMDFVSAQGVQHVFMLPGGGCMHLVDSLGKHPQLTFVCNLHEQACAIAADAYSQYTNKLGVALVTTGPGGTNAITGVAGAWLDSTPCLFLSGQVKRADMKTGRGVRQMGFQEIDIVELVRPITKYAVTVCEPSQIRYHLERAVHMARTGRPGPVWIDIPLDVQSAQIDSSTLAAFVAAESSGAVDLSEPVSRTLDLLEQAQRPIILAGNGVRLAGGLEEFQALIEQLQVPVLTTWKALDFLAEEHPLFVGRPGGTGQRGANFAQQNADWLLILGARLDFGQTGYRHDTFARAACKVMVDVDQSEISKMQMPLDVAVCADARGFLKELLRRAQTRRPSPCSSWLARCKAWQKRYPVVMPEYWEQKLHVNNYVLIEVLSELMTGNDLLIPGSSGACSEITMQAFKAKAGLRAFNSEGLGPMGFGIPAAIGGCLASNRRRTICLDGDGGWVMNIQELEVVRRLNLPIKFFILNNQGYGSIRNSQRNYFEGRFVASNAQSGLTLPDIQAVARAYQLPTALLRDHNGIRQQVAAILNTEGPTVCEVLISPEQFSAPRVSSRQRPDGSMESAPMEDLWPFLERDEFNSNMLI